MFRQFWTVILWMCDSFKLWENYDWNEQSMTVFGQLIIIVQEYWHITSKMIFWLGQICNRRMWKYSDDGSDDKRTKVVCIFVHEVIALSLCSRRNTQDQSLLHLCTPSLTWTLSCLLSALHQVNVRIVNFICHNMSIINLCHS